MFRVAFNPALPVVAASPFMARGVEFASGAAVDWRALGISERMLLDWWLAGLVSHPIAHVEAPVVVPAPVAPTQPKRFQRR